MNAQPLYGVVIALGMVGAAALIAVSRFALAENLFDQPLTAKQLLETVLAQPAVELSATRVLSGKFIQRRYLNGLPRPLVSSGDFILAREQGILWRTTEPFASEFVLAPGGMTLRDGDTETHVSDAERPALRTALEMLFAIFALDVARLADNFELHGLAQGDGWQVGLRPRSGGLAQVFDRAVITGARHVERIELTTAGGDRTELEFAGVVTRATALDATEAARFRQ